MKIPKPFIAHIRFDGYSENVDYFGDKYIELICEVLDGEYRGEEARIKIKEE